jgi:hypothetical protein
LWCLLGFLQCWNLVVNPSYSEVLEATGRDIHEKIGDDGHFGREAGDHGDKKGAEELAEQVDAPHLCVQYHQRCMILVRYDDNLPFL